LIRYDLDPGGSLADADIGRALGICAGRVGHKGHVSRVLIGLNLSARVVPQYGIRDG
jgi:hypothetical protein